MTLKRTLIALLTITVFGQLGSAAELQLQPNSKIVIIGNTLAERMQHFGHFETLLHSRFPQHKLVVRNLGWSADELTLRPRSRAFQDHGHRLVDHKPDVIVACFGFNESFGGPAGLPKFKRDLTNFVKRITTTKYNGKSAPQLVLVTPIAHEDLGRRELPDGKKNNRNLRIYSAAIAGIAKKHDVAFVDLFTPTIAMMAKSKRKWTRNGVHLTDYGYKRLAPVMDRALFGKRPSSSERVNLDALRAEVNEKNLQFWYDYRAVNGFYIYGGRKNPFGVANFPKEFAKLRKMVAVRDQRIWKVANGDTVSKEIDDSKTGDFAKIRTNIKFKITINTPEKTLKSFILPKGYVAELVASEIDFPDLQNPVQMAFDAKGRLWVVTMPSYPQYMPGTPVNDKVLILTDTNGDGKADKSTVFADKLHVPTGIELGDGGAYVAQQPNLVFLKDTNGDGKADQRQIVLHGFDSADSHHSISAFEWGPGGALYFQEGTFHHTQVETPRGPRRVKNAAVFRYEPRAERFGVFVSYGFANPWGHVFDRWGQNFVADASGGANYFGTAFSGSAIYGRKRRRMRQFLKKQWRPTAGCEFVSSRNFPKEAQGNYLLNNCIGFHGVLQYKMKDAGSGFAADPVQPLLRSSDRNFRPVDLQFGPDGALYLIDWFNPLIGHMQHNLRDPNRDKSHGRIWRIRYTGNPLVKPAKIDGQPIAKLLDLLKAYEDRTRYRVRRELRSRPTGQVMAKLNQWLAGLDKSDKQYTHHRLEALWVCQHHDVVNSKLLKSLLRCDDYRARAAATRVLCYWRDRVKDPLGLLQKQVNDKHARVRLEAIRALSFFNSEKAMEIAVEALLHPQDYYLEYTMRETMDTLQARTKAKK